MAVNADYGSKALCCFLPWTFRSNSPETHAEVPTHSIKDVADNLLTSGSKAQNIYQFYYPHIGKKDLTDEEDCSVPTNPQLYMPHEETFLDCLVYLTQISPTNNKSPFTFEQCEIFKRSYTADLYTKRTLQAGLFITGGLGSVGILSGIAAVTTWAATNPYYTFLLGGVLTAVSLTNSLFSFVATGTNPDFSSNAANDRQDTIYLTVDKTYTQLGHALVKMKDAHPQLAKLIAKHLDIEGIKKAMKRDDPKSSVLIIAERCQTLAFAKDFILGKQKLVDQYLINDVTALIIENEKIKKELRALKKQHDFITIEFQKKFPDSQAPGLEALTDSEYITLEDAGRSTTGHSITSSPFSSGIGLLDSQELNYACPIRHLGEGEGEEVEMVTFSNEHATFEDIV